MFDAPKNTNTNDEYVYFKITNNELKSFSKNYFEKLKTESNFKKIKTFQRKFYRKFGF